MAGTRLSAMPDELADAKPLKGPRARLVLTQAVWSDLLSAEYCEALAVFAQREMRRVAKERRPTLRPPRRARATPVPVPETDLNDLL